MAHTLVLHTTEGSTIAGAVAAMKANRSWSNWICDPDTDQMQTLAASEHGDRSLKNLPGGVETNNRPGVWQLEIVGHASTISTESDRWYERLAAVVSFLCEKHGVPKRFPHRFVAYPASYGFKAAQRMSLAEWLTCDGIVGHQHVPEQDHGDPGDLNRLIPLVQGGPMAKTITVPDPHVVQIQEALAAAGVDVGPADGIPGPKLLAGVQQALGRSDNPDAELGLALRDLIARATS